MRRNIPVSTIMTRFPIVVTPGTPLEKIHDIFEDNDFHHLPVINNGKVEGMISKSDYIKVSHLIANSFGKKIGLKASNKNLTARDIMSSPVLQIEPKDSIGLASDIFLSNRLHALPVVDDGELVGIVTSHDILSYAFE